MPCNCDHLHPTRYEAESQSVAKHLLYLASFGFGAATLPQAAADAAKSIYGNPAKVHEWTARLCELCREVGASDVAAKVLWDGRNRDARALADWWQSHQKADAIRKAAEDEKRRAKQARKDAAAALTPDQRAALGIDENGDADGSVFA